MRFRLERQNRNNPFVWHEVLESDDFKELLEQIPTRSASSFRVTDRKGQVARRGDALIKGQGCSWRSQVEKRIKVKESKRSAR